MKSFNILFSILAIVAFATGCMHKEKELLTPNQPELRQAIHHQTTQENKGGDAILRGSICDAPTNVVETPIFGGMLYSWTGSASSYSVKYYLNGTQIINAIVNQPQIQVPHPVTANTTISYYIEIRSICDNNGTSTLSAPLTYIGGDNHGGAGILVCEDLNNLLSTGGTINGYNYLHNTAYNSTSIATVIKVQGLYNTGYGLASTHTIGVTIPSPINNLLLRFTTPNPSSKNTECNINGALSINVSVNIPSPGSAMSAVSAVAYAEDVQGATWYISPCGPGSSVLLPQLKRNTTYKIKFFSTYTKLVTYPQANLPCPSIW